MERATLTISSKNYSSWSLRGWLLCRMAGLDFEEIPVDPDDPEQRQELLLLSPTVRVPRLSHDGVEVWDTLAIANYLNETFPDAGLLPTERVARSHCRSISGEMHSGFSNLRSALPMNIKTRHQHFKIFSGARPDVQHVKDIWSEWLSMYGGPFLFGKPTIINNVETLAHLPSIVSNGSDWFRRQGTESKIGGPPSFGTKLMGVSGHVNKPGVYEFDLGIPPDAPPDAFAAGRPEKAC